MIKVGELKKCGIEIIVGDRWRDGIESDCPICTSYLEGINRGLYVDKLITEFAPRKNAGVEPIFNCDVDLVMTHRSGKVKEGLSEYIVWDKEEGDDFIESWIPSMERLAIRLGKSNQVDINSKPEGFNDSDYINGVPFSQKGIFTDRVYAAIATLKGMGYTFHGGTQWKPPLGVKPVFTKEMADAGKLPPVGSECMVINYMLHNPSWERCVIDFIGSFKAVYSSDSCSERSVSMVHDNVEFDPIPPERDLITSDLEDIIASQGHLNKANITDQIANLIYDAGYRKAGKCNA